MHSDRFQLRMVYDDLAHEQKSQTQEKPDRVAKQLIYLCCILTHCFVTAEGLPNKGLCSVQPERGIPAPILFPGALASIARPRSYLLCTHPCVTSRGINCSFPLKL